MEVETEAHLSGDLQLGLAKQRSNQALTTKWGLPFLQGRLVTVMLPTVLRLYLRYRTRKSLPVQGVQTRQWKGPPWRTGNSGSSGEANDISSWSHHRLRTKKQPLPALGVGCTSSHVFHFLCVLCCLPAVPVTTANG
jgi:hypothetical protein